MDRPLQQYKLFSYFDPLGQPAVTAGRDHCCPYVRTHFSNLAKVNKENNVRYWRDCGFGRVDH